MTKFDFWDEKQAAKYLKVNIKTLQKYRTQGGGPKYFKIFSRVRYTKDLLDEYIKSCVCDNTGQRR